MSSSLRVDSSIIEMPHFDSLTASRLPDFSFGIHHTVLQGKHYIVYLLKNREKILLINPFDSSDTKQYDVNGLLEKHAAYNVCLQGDTLHCLAAMSYNYKQLRLGESLSIIKSMDLKQVFGDHPDEYIYSSLIIDNSLAFADPYLIVPFGSYKGKNNCGSHAWKVVNTFNKEISTALDFPEKYRKCDLRIPDSFILPGDSAAVYATFPKFDKLYKVNVRNGAIINSTADSVFPNRFMCFDIELNYNMAYKDKYEKLDENNENFIFNPASKKIFLIKKLRKISKEGRNECAILIFDTKLKQLGTYYTPADLYPRLSFWYKNGLVIIDKSFSKGHYYEFY